MNVRSAPSITSWIDLTNPEMAEWVYGYLLKKNVLHLVPGYGQQIHPNALLYQFVNDEYPTADKELLVKKMKVAWRQKQFRKSKKKKNESQYFFTLPTKSSRKLDTLAKRNKLTRSQLITALIDAEYFAIQAAKTKNQFVGDSRLRRRSYLNRG